MLEQYFGNTFGARWSTGDRNIGFFCKRIGAFECAQGQKVRKRHPVMADSMMRHLEVGGVLCFQARQCREVVEEAGLALPSWVELSLSPSLAEESEPNQPRHSWQQNATRQLETRIVSDVPRLFSPPSLLQGQRALNCFRVPDCIFFSPCLTALAWVPCAAAQVAGRQALEWSRTCSCATWTLQLLTHTTQA